jgi:hypothetical protein
MTAFRKGWCDGLFVTSGIPRSPVWAMDRILELVEILRVKMGYRGYLHVKAREPALERFCAVTPRDPCPEKTLSRARAAHGEEGCRRRENGPGPAPAARLDGAAPGRARKPSPARRAASNLPRAIAPGSAPVASVPAPGDDAFVVGSAKRPTGTSSSSRTGSSRKS